MVLRGKRGKLEGRLSTSHLQSKSNGFHPFLPLLFGLSKKGKSIAFVYLDHDEGKIPLKQQIKQQINWPIKKTNEINSFF